MSEQTSTTSNLVKFYAGENLNKAFESGSIYFDIAKQQIWLDNPNSNSNQRCLMSSVGQIQEGTSLPAVSSARKNDIYILKTSVSGATSVYTYSVHVYNGTSWAKLTQPLKDVEVVYTGTVVTGVLVKGDNISTVLYNIYNTLNTKINNTNTILDDSVKTLEYDNATRVLSGKKNDASKTATSVTLPLANGANVPGFVKSGGDVTISNGVITVNDDSHNHIMSNIDGLADEFAGIDTAIEGLTDSIEDLVSANSSINSVIDEINNDITAINNTLANKVNTSDIVNNLTTGGTAKVLSAEQGKTLNSSISTINSNITKINTALDGKATIGHGIYYGTCNTESSNAKKIVELADETGFELTVGVVIAVKFEESNGASNPTLNVNGTGEKSIYRYYVSSESNAPISTSQTTSGWRAGAVQLFIYDGTGWVRDFWENSTYNNVALGQGYATCSTAAATTAKTASLSSYALTTGGIVSVKFTYDVPENATLSINSKAAKAIYFKGAKIINGVILGGDLATFIYNGSYYHLLSIDRWHSNIAALQTAVDGKAAASHNHNIGDVNGLQNALDEKTEIGHAHTKADITDFTHDHDDRYYTESEIDTKVSSLETSISGKAPSSHTHTKDNITDFDHSHAINDITNLQTSLNGKSDTGHSHDDKYYTKSEINNKVSSIETSISGKASATHEHNKADIKDFDHSHAIEDITSLQTSLNGKSDTGHAHDDKYYTENEIDSTVSAIQTSISNLSASVDNLLKVDENTANTIKDIVDTVSANKTSIDAILSDKVDKTDIVDNLTTENSQKVLSAKQGKVLNDSISTVSDNLANLKYAGSSSRGGAATSAEKLNTTTAVGNATQPVYFKEDGKPYAISYTIAKSVPSTAVFTDTTYEVATTSKDGLMSAGDKTKFEGLLTDVAGKSNIGHTHNKEDIENFDHTHIKADITDFAHNHTISEITNLQTTLNSKAAASDLSALSTTVSGIKTQTDASLTNTPTSFSGKTIQDVKSHLMTWVQTHYNYPAATTRFQCSGNWADLWNANDTTTLLEGGNHWTVSFAATYNNAKYFKIRVTNYGDKKVFYIACYNEVWGQAYEIAYKDELVSQISTINETITNINETLTDSIDTVSSDVATKATAGHGIYYGTCNTESAGVEKTVTLTDATGFSLIIGTIIAVKFEESNGATDPTLNVNGTGAKPIYRYYASEESNAPISTSQGTSGWRAGAVQIFVYDGTGWVRDFWENSTYSLVKFGCGYATCTTAAATTAKTVTLSSYTLTTGGLVAIKFNNAVPANATLKVGSTTAKSIYYKGSAIEADVIKAGDTALFTYSSQYHLIAIDRWQNDIAALKTAVEGKAPSSHTHNISDINSLQSSLNGKSDTGHTHTKANITDFAHNHNDIYYTETEIDNKISAINTSISGKAPSSHTHTKANITNFDHSHAISEITSLQTTLDSKSNTGHTHDDRYYTESEINTKVNAINTSIESKVNKSGDTMTGSLTFANTAKTSSVELKYDDTYKTLKFIFN